MKYLRYVSKNLLLGIQLIWMRVRLWPAKDRKLFTVLGMEIEATSGRELYMQLKDVYIQGIYDFNTRRAQPIIIDGGSNVGIAAMRFKKRFPAAKVICFEPDRQVFEILKRNIARSGLNDVRVERVGLGSIARNASFRCDGGVGGQVVDSPEVSGDTIAVVPLSKYITEDVDMVKLNIEGAECEVLEELEMSGSIGKIKNFVIEFHGWGSEQPQLSRLLGVLERSKFRYCIHDFDSETSPASKPPFKAQSRETWFCLVRAWREET